MENATLISEIASSLKNMCLSPVDLPEDLLLKSVHIPPGPLYQGEKRKRALLTLKHNELEGIYHLTESHAPGLRFRATLQYEKVLNSTNNNSTPKTLKKDFVEFPCAHENLRGQIDSMLKKVEEMPKEWTIVQLTPQFNRKERCNTTNMGYFFTNPIHVSVFNCGGGKSAPFCVTTAVPFDNIANKTIEICTEMRNIVEENKLLLANVHVTKEGRFRHYKDKKAYQDARDLIDCRLKNIVQEMQWKWLKEFRCLLIGNLSDETVENEITVAVEQFFNSSDLPSLSSKQNAIIRCLIKGAMYLKLNEQKRLVEQLFPALKKDVQRKIVKFAQDLNDRLKLHEIKRHSVLLIVDDKLDFLPWEMLDVLENHPATRMPSLHFVYALFKEHEDTIEGGFKVIPNPTNNGVCVLDPEANLEKMQTRMGNFFQYYWPQWKRVAGVKPTPEEFEGLLTSSDVFSYHGHGNGRQFLSGDKIQRLRVRAVTLLFGCSSVTLAHLGPKVEMVGQHHTYLIACSPCVVGMLWTVTDLDTDVVTTGFLSRWVASNAPCHWNCVNKTAWLTQDGAIKPSVQMQVKQLNEPELLRALCKAKKEAKHYATTAACVSRGLPVKIKY